MNKLQFLAKCRKNGNVAIWPISIPRGVYPCCHASFGFVSKGVFFCLKADWGGGGSANSVIGLLLC